MNTSLEIFNVAVKKKTLSVLITELFSLCDLLCVGFQDQTAEITKNVYAEVIPCRFFSFLARMSSFPTL